MGSDTLFFYDLPKLSLNEWYAGKHWTERSRMKNAYKLLIRSKYKGTITSPADVEYIFEFKGRLLDCSNCIAMVKLIEDIVFEKDTPEFVRSLRIVSKKGKANKVQINITY